MKTNYSLVSIQAFLKTLPIGAEVISLEKMNEGYSSQVFRFSDTEGKKWVIRIRDSYHDLVADRYASSSFGGHLPIPKVVDVGRFDNDAYYCINEYCDGTPMNMLDETQYYQSLPSLQAILAAIYTTDISNSAGYGEVDFKSGNALYSSNKDALVSEVEDLDIKQVSASANSLGLQPGVTNKLIESFRRNLPFVSESRRLLHGDPGGDNFIINDSKVAAVLDWEQMTYGDWLRDYSRFSYWNRRGYLDAESFGREFNLEIENIKERTAVYFALHTLRNIQFAARPGNEKVSAWLHWNIERILDVIK